MNRFRRTSQDLARWRRPRSASCRSVPTTNWSGAAATARAAPRTNARRSVPDNCARGWTKTRARPNPERTHARRRRAPCGGTNQHRPPPVAATGRPRRLVFSSAYPTGTRLVYAAVKSAPAAATAAAADNEAAAATIARDDRRQMRRDDRLSNSDIAARVRRLAKLRVQLWPISAQHRRVSCKSDKLRRFHMTCNVPNSQFTSIGRKETH